MFQRHRDNHRNEIISAGLIGMMLGLAGSLALVYPQENRDRAEGLFSQAKDRWNSFFEEEELEKPQRSRRKLLKKTS